MKKNNTAGVIKEKMLAIIENEDIINVKKENIPQIKKSISKINNSLFWFSYQANKKIELISISQGNKTFYLITDYKVDEVRKLITELSNIGEDIFPLSDILKTLSIMGYVGSVELNKIKIKTIYKNLKNFTEVKQISPTLLAEYIVYKKFVEKNPINNNELNAMIKIINDLYKQSIDKELLDTEVVFSGIYPKYIEVYYKYSKYGVLPIIFDFDINKLAEKELEEKIGKNNVKVINGILKKYSKYDLYELIEVINGLSSSSLK